MSHGGELPWNESLSPELYQVVNGLLQPNTEMRLGCRGKGFDGRHRAAFQSALPNLSGIRPTHRCVKLTFWAVRLPFNRPQKSTAKSGLAALHILSGYHAVRCHHHTK
eukprot:7080255-Prymnesium_polylepis.1